MSNLAALKFIIELLTQLTSLGEEGLSRVVQRMNYIREIVIRASLPSIQEFIEFLDQSIKSHFVDCDADPVTPLGLTVKQHIKGGKIRLELRGGNLCVDGRKVVLHLSKRQVGGKAIVGHELRQELENGKLVLLNDNVLDWLLAHPEFIPKKWKGKTIFFWGTVYCASDGRLCVRYLFWADSQWPWDYHWLGYGWDSDSPAAVLASN